MKDRKKTRKVLASKVINRVERLKRVLNIKVLLEEMSIPTKGESFDFVAEYILKVPFGLEEC